MITINFQTNTINFNRRVLVALKRVKNKIEYSSGLIYFNKLEDSKDFEHNMKLKGFDVVEVDIKKSHPPDRLRSTGIYCPYCKQQEVWRNTSGYKVCPVCGMSDHDFYVKKYNGLKEK